MADNTIITPGYQEDIIDEVEQTAEQCLIKDNCLSEYDNDSDRSRVRANIEVPHIEDVYNKSEVDNKVSSIYKYKGSVANKEALPTENLAIGDVYNLEDTGMNVAYTGEK